MTDQNLLFMLSGGSFGALVIMIMSDMIYSNKSGWPFYIIEAGCGIWFFMGALN
jgi:hypothetical protein